MLFLSCYFFFSFRKGMKKDEITSVILSEKDIQPWIHDTNMQASNCSPLKINSGCLFYSCPPLTAPSYSWGRAGRPELVGMVTCPGERGVGGLSWEGVRKGARIPCGLDLNQRPQTPAASQSARPVKDTHLKMSSVFR